MREPRRPRTVPCTSSRWIIALRRPRSARDAFRRHRHDRIEVRPRERAVRPGAADQLEQLVLGVLHARRFRDDLLRQHVERRVVRDDRDPARRGEPPGPAPRTRRDRRATSGTRGPSACPETVWPERPTRCSSVAIRCGEPIWQTRSTAPMSMPSSSDAVATSAFSVPALSRDSASNRRSFERLPWWAVTASSPSRSLSSWRQRVRQGAACSRTPASSDAPESTRSGGRSTRPTTSFDITASSDDCGISTSSSIARRCPSSTMAQSARPASSTPAVPTRNRATSSIGFCVADRPMRCTRPSATCLQPLERQGEVRTAARADHGVNLVDDDRAHGAQHLAAALRRQQQVQRFRRRHQDVRRRAEHGGALGLRRVAGANGARHAARRQPHVGHHAADAAPGSARFLWMSALSAFSGET